MYPSTPLPCPSVDLKPPAAFCTENRVWQAGLFSVVHSPLPLMRDLPPTWREPRFQINVLPFESLQFSPSQPSGQFQVVEFEHTTLLGLPQERLKLF